MSDLVATANPVALALLGTLFTWFMTALGSSLVLFFKTIKPWILDSMLGAAAGVMIAASFWSLLNPAIQMSAGSPWPAVIGFLAGSGFLRLVDLLLPHLHMGHDQSESEGLKTPWGKTTLLFLAVTLHNFPEGLAVGVAFGAVGYGLPESSLASAIALALGIGIQNLPEGAAVSIPLRREGMSRWKSFFWGQFSGMVEPLGGLLGAGMALIARPLLPYALSFAAGAMIYVVVEEVIPESQRGENAHLATMGVILGFTVMMALDVLLG
ncbi:MAG TPA: ZIP family metal transporter [Candidatus Cloacimonadota bacterium]|jgi:ZIP family zinc transporter|nr:ZIP family metal transporter [Candidatus Cloacimonadota bacterium]HOF59316.1 ZIP family metal transporter [Candidatus Cloacimonadota bacterium]HOR58365.1 ZIP family metal transporter [Candidatus Cloacimonadota bacterium]HPB08727.1 ZIP family metal transporter [Candidatus Cloacimonadota bacterium]HPL23490.1 ZIP family metal transporter [Candidatus Cloacimonadota bacterium]